MPSLLDIGKLTRTVSIRGVEVEVGGLSGSTFLHLLDKFPELRKIMAAGQAEPDPAVLVAQVPGAVAAAIAAGTGSPDNSEAEATAMGLSLGEQVEILSVIWELTFPRGIKNFIDALEKLAKEVIGAPGWAQVTRSPGQSNNVSTTDTKSK